MRGLAAFTLAGPALVLILAIAGLRGGAAAVPMATVPLGVFCAIALSCAHSLGLGKEQRRAFLATLEKPSRIHGMNKPPRVQLFGGWCYALMGSGLVALCTVALARSAGDPGNVAAAGVIALVGLLILWAGLRRAADYQLQHDAWQESRDNFGVGQ